MGTSSGFRILRVSALLGAAAWLAYGVVELACLAILPRIVEVAHEYRAFDVWVSGLCLVLYALLGALSGLAAGFVVPRFAGSMAEWDQARLNRFWQAFHTAALNGLLLASLFISRLSWQVSPLWLAVALVAILALSIASMSSGTRALRWAPFSAAWLPCVCYLVPLWLTGWARSAGASSGRAGLYACALMAGFAMVAWFAAKAASGRGNFPMRALIRTSVLAVACCLATAVLRPTPYRVAAPPPRAAAQERPNVILIVLDTVRADHLSLYGYGRNTTPTLKKLAAESTVFTRAASSADMSLPSHASLFTGLYPSQHGAHFSADHRMGVPLDSRFVTLAEMLSAKGFWTGGVVSNGGYLSVSFGLQQGFTYWDQRLPPVALAPLPDPYLRSRIRNLAVRFLPSSELDRVTRSAAEINDRAFTALSERPQDRPFFLFLNYMDAHVPYIPPAPYDKMFPGKDPSFTEGRYLATYLDVVAGNHKISDRARDHLVSQYDGAIAYLDAQLATLFQRLKERGSYDNSLIIITSDHGEAHGERNSMDHGGISLYQDQIHIPLLVKYPGKHPGAIVEQPASSIDIVPTVLDVAGLPAPSGLPGISLANPASADRQYVISESFPGGRAYFANQARFNRTYRSLMSPLLKYIAGSAGRPELYDIPRDPEESKNLYDSSDGKSQMFAARLSEWTRSTGRQGTGPVKIDNNAMERLRGLGYVQ